MVESEDCDWVSAGQCMKVGTDVTVRRPCHQGPPESVVHYTVGGSSKFWHLCLIYL